MGAKALRQELSQTQTSLEEMRRELTEAVEGQRKSESNAKDAVGQATQRIGEAQDLLRRQISDSACARQELLRIAQEREVELLEELGKVRMHKKKYGEQHFS